MCGRNWFPSTSNDQVCSAHAMPGRTYLGAGLCAVHDGVAAIQRERVLQLGQALLCEVVSGVNQPAIGLGNQRLMSGAVSLTGQSSSLVQLKAPGAQKKGGSLSCVTASPHSLILTTFQGKAPSSLTPEK